MDEHCNCDPTPKCTEGWEKAIFIHRVSEMAREYGVSVKTDCFNYIYLYITELGKEK